MESRLQDHERIRGGLFFIQSIPRDENWKVRRDILQAYEPKQPEDCTLNVSASLPDIKTPASSLSTPEVSSSPKLNRKVTEVTPLEKQANGAYVAAPEIHVEASASPRTKRAAVGKRKKKRIKRCLPKRQWTVFWKIQCQEGPLQHLEQGEGTEEGLGFQVVEGLLKLQNNQCLQSHCPMKRKTT